MSDTLQEVCEIDNFHFKKMMDPVKYSGDPNALGFAFGVDFVNGTKATVKIELFDKVTLSIFLKKYGETIGSVATDVKKIADLFQEWSIPGKDGIAYQILLISEKDLEKTEKDGTLSQIFHDDKNPVPLTLRRMFREGDVIAAECGKVGAINLSDIATILIQNTGRFAEHYASDFLFSWDQVRELTEKERETSDNIVCFGIRRNGVDGNKFVMERLYGRVDSVYRKLFAVRVVTVKREDGSPSCFVQLRDLSNL